MFNNADTKKNQNNMLIKPAGVGIIFTLGGYARTIFVNSLLTASGVFFYFHQNQHLYISLSMESSCFLRDKKGRVE